MPNKVARVYEAFSIKDSVGGMSQKLKDQVSNIIYDSRNDANKVTLLSEAAVTHAGIVNANMGYYKPDKLQASIRTWLEPYNKPVLVNHDKNKDAIGRVKGSVYQATVPSLIPKVKNSVYESDYSYRGLGHIKNLLEVTDADAVNKVLDGRYLTLSVSGDNDEMTCSICHQEWLNDGKCVHRFGQHYEDERTGEDKLAYWTAGNFLWDEVSFVNEPADPFAQVLTREVGENKDQILQVYNYKDATNIEKQVEDSRDRHLKLYVVNDAKHGMIELNDRTDLGSLYKVYDVRLHPVNADLKSKEKESTLADLKVEEKTLETAPATIVADNKTEAAAVLTATTTENVAATTVTVADNGKVIDVKTEPVAKVEDAALKAAIADATKPLEDKLKDLEPKIQSLETAKATLEDEKKALTKEATDLQDKIRDMRMEQILDLKEALGTDTFATEADRKAAKDSMTSRTIDSIEDQVKDLTASLKKHKRPGPANIKIGDSGAIEAPTSVQRLETAMDKMSAQQLLALKFGGKFSPPVKK